MKSLWVFLWAMATAISAANATVFTVTTTEDSGPGSLRQAIHEANASFGADSIAFNIPGSGVPTIAPLTPLPDLTNFVYLNAATQPVAWAVRLDGVNLTSPGDYALTVRANNCIVRGLVIVRFPYGILIDSGSGNSIVGNRIGLDVDGVARGMTFDGITVTCPVFGVARNNVIGGTQLGDRNYISGNGRGITFSPASASHNYVQGNFIGTDVTGTLPRGNIFAGVAIIGATNITIGGPGAGAGNLLSASTGGGGSGVSINGGSGHLIQGNFIGTDVSGQYALGNYFDGIFMLGVANVQIRGNQIVNNGGNGITLQATDGSFIEGNRIGTDASGLRVMGNALAGVAIDGNTNRVGGLTAGAPNLIQFNGGAGVAVTFGERNEISGNLIYDNDGLGIDLGFLGGVTPNDEGDTDTGPNRLQNFPILSSALSAYSATTVQGSLNSAAAAGFRLEFFASPPWDIAGLSEGQIFLGATSMTTDPAGNTPFLATLPVATPSGYRVTATATDALGNTSEFSAAVPVSDGPQSVSLAITNHASTVTVSWPGAATRFQLEATSMLNSTSQWQTVTSGISDAGLLKVYSVTNSGAGSRFFRLRKS